MKHKLFYAVILAIALALAVDVDPARSAAPSPLPVGYYNSPCQRPPHLTFYDWMATLQIPPYKLNAFDCSQMSAYAEWLAENCGHRAIFLARSGEVYGHAWVAIDIGGRFFAYEPTLATEEHAATNPWVRGGGGHVDAVWASLYDVPWWGGDLFEMEFAWWKTCPSLINGAWPLRLSRAVEGWE